MLEPMSAVATKPLAAAGREASVAVLGKGSAILDALAPVREATAAELAETVGEPRSSVHRLLVALAELDLVEAGSRRGTFRLGLRLLRLGSAVAAHLDVRTTALPVMERIHRETGDTVFLCLRRGREAVCVERIDGRRAAVMELKLGDALPLHVGAGPRVLLAFDEQQEWEDYFAAEPRREYLGGAPLTHERFLAELTEARRLGAAVSDEDLTRGFAAVGAPVYDHGGRLCAALSISGIRDDVLGADADRVRATVTGGAREISRALGHVEHRQEVGV